jgi:hypothetical protein
MKNSSVGISKEKELLGKGKRKEGREGRREGKEGRKEGGREGKEGRKEGGREGGKEGRGKKERKRERKKERKKEGRRAKERMACFWSSRMGGIPGMGRRGRIIERKQGSKIKLNHMQSNIYLFDFIASVFSILTVFLLTNLLSVHSSRFYHPLCAIFYHLDNLTASFQLLLPLILHNSFQKLSQLLLCK